MYYRLKYGGLQFGTKHKLNVVIKRLLNEVVKPSPNLTVNDVFDKALSAAIVKLKHIHKIEPLNSTIDLKLCAKIGELLGERRVGEEEKLDREIGKLLSGELLPPPYTSETERCDKEFARIFGGSGAVAFTAFEYNGVYRGRDPKKVANMDRSARYGDPRSGGLSGNSYFDAEHLYNFPHLSGNKDATQNTEIYVPPDFEGQPTKPTPGSGVVTLFYKKAW